LIHLLRKLSNFVVGIGLNLGIRKAETKDLGFKAQKE